MAKPISAKVKVGDGVTLADGSFATVVLVGEAKAEYEALLKRKDNLSTKQCTQLKRYFERYASHGGDYLDDRMFKSQGRVKDGAGNEHLIYEFKAFKYRVYGVVRQHAGKRHFIGIAVNPKKDQQKADPADLLRTAKGASAIGDD